MKTYYIHTTILSGLNNDYWYVAECPTSVDGGWVTNISEATAYTKEAAIETVGRLNQAAYSPSVATLEIIRKI